MTTTEYLNNCVDETILEANNLFVEEGPSHDLFVAPYGCDNIHMFRLGSTSGTTYFVGDKESCLSRQDDLLLFALTGH